MKRTEYPLAWPPNWPRTPESSRTDNRNLKATLASSIDRVRRELALFGKQSGKAVTSILISSNVTLTSAAPKDAGVAVYFTWDGIDTCLAVDRYRGLAQNLQALALVIEAERTKLRHGGLNLVRASFTGYAALPKAERPWHEVLEVPAGATAATIRDAYNRKRSRAHPDHGGSAEAFREVQAAFEQAQQRGLVP